jgi:hypothetical protein
MRLKSAQITFVPTKKIKAKIMKSQKIATRTFGVFFLLAFLSYGLGSGMVESILNVDNPLVNIHQNKGQLTLSVVLMALVHTVVNIGLPVIMATLLKRYNKFMGYGYLSAGIAATVIAVFGAIFIMLLVPLSAMYVNAEPADITYYETLSVVLQKGGYYSYQISMAIWGVGGLMFCRLLCLSKLVPRFFAVWGTIGYAIFIAGCVAELFGSEIGVMLSLPGGLFEIVLSIWLIIKGFKTSDSLAPLK